MCKAIDMKIIFYFHANKTHFSFKVFSLNLFLELGNDPLLKRIANLLSLFSRDTPNCAPLIQSHGTLRLLFLAFPFCCFLDVVNRVLVQ